MRLTDIMDDKAIAQKVMPAVVALGEGNAKKAFQDMQGLLQGNAKVADYHYIMSEVLIVARNLDGAIAAIANAQDLDPDRVHFHAHHAHCLLYLGQFEDALLDARQAWDGDPGHANTCDVLGAVFTGVGELELALKAFERAVELSPGELHFKFNLATALRAVGRLEEAEAIYDKVILFHPHDWQAYRNRADLRKQTPARNHVDEMEEILPETQGNKRGEFQLLGALAKELADLDRYDQSFTYLKRSADLRRGLMNYKVEGDIETMRALGRTYTSDVMTAAAGAGHDSAEPIFIVGLPRTGTTLLERMLGSHSQVFAAGELQNFAIEFVKLAKETFPGETLDKLSLVPKSTGLDFAELGRRYIDGTRPRTGHTRFFIDKLPLNFLYVGLIHLALPNAKIVHLTRHPMDAAYAIYKTPFDQAYPYSYSLDDLGKYYVAYHGLMDHWRAALPGTVLDVAYEDMVADPERELRRVKDHCGLTWQPKCLDFHESSAPTNTASAAQVRQPIYTSSVQKWKRVEAGLGPLKSIFEAAGIEI